MNKHGLIILLLFSYHLIAEAELKIFPLFHQHPNDIIHQIKPFLEPNETIVAGHNELIIRIHSNNISDISQLIKKLDKASQQLIVIVDRHHNHYQKDNTQQINTQANILLNSPSKSTVNAQTHIYSHTQSFDEGQVEKIKVLDGQTAFISAGVEEPITTVNIQPYNTQALIMTNTHYRAASKGFYVRPQLTGSGSVILNISVWSEEPLSKNTNAAKFTQGSSTIKASLNQWVNLSSSEKKQSGKQSQMFGHHYSTSKAQQAVWVKVVRP